ncbi:MAG: hypothetical protein P1V97_36145, partial [Planctomycetota bacterium]|nr:hypothetical protein [Planctomycetota bacterium]
MDRSIWFGGVDTLIRSKFRLISASAFLGFLVACFFGGVLQLDSIRLSKLDDIVIGWCLSSLVLAPFLMGAYTTLSPVQGRFGSRPRQHWIRNNRPLRRRPTP